MVSSESDESSDLKKRMFQKAESLEFSGKAVAHLAADRNVHKKTGRVLLSADVAREYGFGEDDGSDINDMREIRGVLAIKGWTTLAGYVPSFVRVPHFLFYMMGYKF